MLYLYTCTSHGPWYSSTLVPWYQVWQYHMVLAPFYYDTTLSHHGMAYQWYRYHGTKYTCTYRGTRIPWYYECHTFGNMVHVYKYNIISKQYHGTSKHKQLTCNAWYRHGTRVPIGTISWLLATMVDCTMVLVPWYH
jgi:hypothetical protein